MTVEKVVTVPFVFVFVFTLNRNVFKRLRFLGNKMVSHLSTLLFLTLWHGLHSGYFMCFAMEFIIITVEKQVGAHMVVMIPNALGLFAWAIMTRLCFKSSVLSCFFYHSCAIVLYNVQLSVMKNIPVGMFRPPHILSCELCNCTIV